VKPFSEDKIFDLYQPTGSFYSTGLPASFGEKPGTFSGDLRTKDQVKVSFVVKNPVSMLAKSSSIYYYDQKQQQWLLPPNSVSDHVGPFDKFAVSTDWPDQTVFPFVYSGSQGEGWTRGTIITEDFKGFDCYGRSMMSGSLNIYRQVTSDVPAYRYNQSDETLTRAGVSTNIPLESLSRDYDKSVQRSSTYDAAKDQTFQIDITRPFLVEKAVIEVPVNFGSSWFQDRSISGLGISTGSYISNANPMPSSSFVDSGGPGLTFSLFCQKNYGLNKVRDLILTGVVTHKQDNRRQATKPIGATLAGISGFWRLMQGIDSPAVFVEKDGNGQFTGSILLKTEAAISNGLNGIIAKPVLITGSLDPIFKVNKLYPLLYTPESYLERLWKQLSSKELSIAEIATENTEGQTIAYGLFDPYGRGMTGFSPSGGSIFGKEHKTQSLNPKAVPNPWYIDNEADRLASYTELSATIAAAAAPFLTSSSPIVYNPGVITSGYEVIDVGSVFTITTQSPYLVNPGDNLVLAVSKTRPMTSESKSRVTDTFNASYGIHSLRSQTYFTGSSNGHDVSLATGSIHITLYGSYVKEGKTYVR